jgi:phosphoglycerate kinase
MDKLLLKDLNVRGQRILMRVDFNVPFKKDGSIADTTRIKEALPSIHYVLKNGGSIILMSHLGRPDGKRNEKNSLSPVAAYLQEILQTPVIFASDCIGEETRIICSKLKPGQVVVLENLRFYAAEEKPSSDPTFAKRLASLADGYVNDGFGTAHRKHASVTEVPKFFPKRSAAGFLMEKEMKNLHILLQDTPRPFYAIIGGSKISSKIGVLQSLISKVDALFIGGGMTYTFLKAEGIPIGDSICENTELETAKTLQKSYKKAGIPLYIAQDFVAAKEYSETAEKSVFTAKEGIPDHWQGMDIGPETCSSWNAILGNAKTVFWNGPVGVYEFPRFATGTQAVAKTLSELKNSLTIIGGGDSVAAIQNFGLQKNFTHLSTGGGAALEYLEYGYLPGIDALTTC